MKTITLNMFKLALSQESCIISEKPTLQGKILIWLILLFINISFFPPAGLSQETQTPLTERLFFDNLQKLKAYRARFHDWDRFVQGFREKHHVGISTGGTLGTWYIRRAGSIRELNLDSSGIFTKFKYSFHLPLFHGFGYFIGSSAGYIFESNNSATIKEPSAILLPGLLIGMVNNFGSAIRVAIGLDYHLERWDDFGIYSTSPEEHRTISVTGRTKDFFAVFDLFYRLKWAVRFEYHQRVVDYNAPRDAIGKAVNVDIVKKDKWYGAGLLYHIL